MQGRHRNMRRQGPSGHPSLDNTDSYDVEQRLQVADAPRGCVVTAWAFCVVGAAVLVIPVVLFLLPLIQLRLLAAPLQGLTPSTATTTATPAPKTTPSEPPREQCFRPTFNVTGAQNVADFPPPSFVQRTDFFVMTQQVYCIYNVSRFRRPNGQGFLPAHVPFSLCPNLVYWSWSLSGGKLTSRAKDFDKEFGLEVIHSIWNRQKNAQLRRYQSPSSQLEPLAVLLTVGGFSEDSPDFYSLENNQMARQNLVQDFFEVYRRYNLSGINFHWVRDSESCEITYGSGFPRLGRFLDSLRKLVDLNIDTPSFFKVTAMLDPRSQHDMSLFHSLRGRLDLAFFRTHSPPDSDFPEHSCDSSVLELQALVSRLTPFFEKKSSDTRPQRRYYRDLCMSLSLALIAREGERAAPARPVSATPGRMALFELCGSNRSFASVASARTAGCEVRRSTGPTPHLTYAVEYADTLQAKMELLGFRENTCVLLYDLDFDNFQRACFSQEFLMLQHFLKARYPTRSFNLFSHLP